jgi:hypothetical protein
LQRIGSTKNHHQKKCPDFKQSPHKMKGENKIQHKILLTRALCIKNYSKFFVVKPRNFQ